MLNIDHRYILCKHTSLEAATRSGRRRSRSGYSAMNSWAKNLSNREHPCGSSLHSRRSPRMGRAQEPLEHRLVA